MRCEENWSLIKVEHLVLENGIRDNVNGKICEQMENQNSCKSQRYPIRRVEERDEFFVELFSCFSKLGDNMFCAKKMTIFNHNHKHNEDAEERNGRINNNAQPFYHELENKEEEEIEAEKNCNCSQWFLVKAFGVSMKHIKE